MRPITVVSNRLPLVLQRSQDRFAVREGAGGLVTAVKPLLAQRGGAWIGFCGMYDTDRQTGWEEILEQYGGGKIRYHAITPSRPVYQGYYLQYANQELWPRFHGMTAKMSRQAANYWSDYQRMNELFAEHAERLAVPESLIWIQDYHLMLLPWLLRQRIPDRIMGHFLHIPFPDAPVMADQPHARQLLEGVLGADLLGFHIPAYMQNFVEAARQILPVSVVQCSDTEAALEYAGRTVHLGVFPIGIQPIQLEQANTATVRERLQGSAETIILSMDRLDYTKAVPPRLQAYMQLLERYPELHGRVTLVQLLDLSRKDIPAYQEELEDVQALTQRIQRRFSGWKAIHFAAERWERAEVAALMKASRVCVVTPRCDGMNLVSKEYVAAAPDDGVLVLSRQAGAAWQLGPHCVLVDANDPATIVEGMATALQMPEDERRSRMEKLKENVRRQDVFWWANGFLEQLQRAAGLESSAAE